MTRAIAEFLSAAGLSAGDPHLRETPRRVAEAFAAELLDGYGQSPAQVLGERYPVPARPSSELVVLTDLRFQSMCPHHLMPYSGRAHIAYAPGRYLVGFGRVAALLDCFAHRLILQEDLSREVARALTEALPSSGAACILEAEQTCLRHRGELQRDAVTHSEAYEGVLARDATLRRELWSRVASRSL